MPEEDLLCQPFVTSYKDIISYVICFVNMVGTEMKVNIVNCRMFEFQVIITDIEHQS